MPYMRTLNFPFSKIRQPPIFDYLVFFLLALPVELFRLSNIEIKR